MRHINEKCVPTQETNWFFPIPFFRDNTSLIRIEFSSEYNAQEKENNVRE